jgi:hypothetical protein
VRDSQAGLRERVEIVPIAPLPHDLNAESIDERELEPVEHMLDALWHAEYCRRVADATSDAGTPAEFLRLEWRWLHLAESYQLSDRVSRWIDAIRRRRQSR